MKISFKYLCTNFEKILLYLGLLYYIILKKINNKWKYRQMYLKDKKDQSA